MKMTAKLLSVLLCAAMLISLLPITVSAAVLGDLQYEVKDDHVVITLCKNTATSVDIPAQIDGLPVTEIGDGAFSDCSNLKSVTIPSSVTSIGYSAFDWCRNLERVNISDLASWCSIAFADNSAHPLYISESKDRGIYMNGNKLTNITIPNGVTSVSAFAFYNCIGITSVTIPSSVTSIGEFAFSWCGYYNNTKNWKNGVLYIGDWLIEADKDTIPSNYTITSGTRCIADYAFYGCSWLESVTIPSSVTNIGEYSFHYCLALTSLIIPSGVTSIGNGVFSGCSALTSVTISSGATSIGRYVFSGCSALTSVTIPSSVTSIGAHAFSGCDNLGRVNISDLASWCSIAFGDAYAHPFYSSESVDRGIYINGNKLTDITIPNGVTSIGSYAFYDCVGITSVTIPSGVTSIESGAFYGCSALTSVTIPSSVMSIGFWAFNRCDNLATVYYSGSEAQWRNIDIGSSNSALKSATIHYLGTDEGDPKPPVIEYPYTINGLSLVSVSGEALTAPPSDSAFMVNVELEKTKSRSAQDYLFVAVYDTRGALLSLDYVRANFTYNSGLEFGFYVPAQTRKIGSIKAFVWTGFNTEQPLCESVEIKN